MKEFIRAGDVLKTFVFSVSLFGCHLQCKLIFVYKNGNEALIGL